MYTHTVTVKLQSTQNLDNFKLKNPSSLSAQVRMGRVGGCLGCIYTYSYSHTHTYIHTSIHTNTYSRTYTHTHVHTHIYTHTLTLPLQAPDLRPNALPPAEAAFYEPST